MGTGLLFVQVIGPTDKNLITCIPLKQLLQNFYVLTKIPGGVTTIYAGKGCAILGVPFLQAGNKFWGIIFGKITSSHKFWGVISER